jgi:fluoroacetyl-CoA thioesterase
MKPTLKPGLKHSFSYKVPENKTVPYTYPESQPHLDSGKGSLGTHVDVSHLAATPIGFTVTVDAELVAVDGRKLTFRVRAHDDKDLIGEGHHERVVVAWDRFNARLAEKAKSAAEMVN